MKPLRKTQQLEMFQLSGKFLHMPGRDEACHALIFLPNFILKYLNLWLTYFREGKQIGEMVSHRVVLKGRGL